MSSKPPRPSPKQTEVGSDIFEKPISTEEISIALSQKPAQRSTAYQWVGELSIDSRTIMNGEKTLFVALKGNHSDGSDFAVEAYQKGVRCFVLPLGGKLLNLPESTVFLVKDPVKSLQKLAKYKRGLASHTTVIAVTGSAGKTIVKEWLSQILSQKHVTLKSPRSFNSQIGVPLSVWHLQANHQMAVFEAGISKENEMENLRLVIQPQIGILTNIGSAHDAGFENRDQKLKEKLQLFAAAKALICCEDQEHFHLTREILQGVRLITWSEKNSNAYLFIESENRVGQGVQVYYRIKNQTFEAILPFTDKASIENALHVLTCLHFLNEGPAFIKDQMALLQNLPLRLEVSHINNQVSLVNDAYINDFSSLKTSLDFTERFRIGRQLVAIITDIQESGLSQEAMEYKLSETLAGYKPESIYYLSQSLIPEAWHNQKQFKHFQRFELLEKHLAGTGFKDTIILIKGSRKYHMERLFYALKQKSHTARLTIDLNAIEHNISVYKSLAGPNRKIMAVIKGSAYGSGAEAIGQLMQHKNIEYLAVANADEGKQLRQAGVHIPIVILNPDGFFAYDLIQYGLQAEVFTMSQLKNLISELFDQNIVVRIHIKLDTGMHRLGFMEEELTELADLLKSVDGKIHVESIFSHLASSEDAGDDDFTREQLNLFDLMYAHLSQSLGYQPLKHILNTAGIVRFPEREDTMVRLGLGLYGIDTTGQIPEKLEKAHALTASIIQAKLLPAMSYVGYNRRAQVTRPSKIGIVNIGYADGLIRIAGNGKFDFIVEGKKAPILGNICMDLTIVDITDIPQAREGSQVIIFNAEHPVEELAMACQTIPYEIISRLAPRIVREYIM